MLARIESMTWWTPAKQPEFVDRGQQPAELAIDVPGQSQLVAVNACAVKLRVDRQPFVHGDE